MGCSASILKFRSIGGGPAPLLKNPCPTVQRRMALAHVFLLLSSLVQVVVPNLLDLGSDGCQSGNDSTAYAVMGLAISLVLVVALIRTSNLVWASETEWMAGLLILLLLMCLELGVCAWAIIILVRMAPQSSACVSSALYWLTVVSGGAAFICAIANVWGSIIIVTDVRAQLDLMKNLY